jgi:uncharacterized membrane protein YfcA
MVIMAAYLLLGALAGLLAGLLGIGGGIVIVPVLFFLYHWQDFPRELSMHMAVGSSLATVVFTSLISAYAHHRRGAVLWPSVARLVPGVVVGALLGAAIAGYLPGRTLRVCFGLFELFVGAQLAFGFKPMPHRLLPGSAGMAFAGVIVGSVSTVLGIGGGTLTVPFLLWCNVAIRQAVATSAACGLPIALVGSIGFVVTGWGSAALPAWSSGYVYWPAVVSVVAASTFLAPVGAWLAHTLPVTMLKRLFAVIVAIIGIRMLI